MNALKKHWHYYDGLYIAIGAMLTLIFSTIYGSIKFNENTCDTYAELNRVTTQYLIFGGCYVQEGDQWITKSNYERRLVVIKESS